MSLKRTLINPNLTGLKSWENFDVKNRTIKTPPRYPKNRTSWFPYKTQSLPNLSKIDHKLLEKDLETAVKDATRNLRCQTLYLLLEVPIVLSNNLITKILFVLLFCSFSRKIYPKNRTSWFPYKTQSLPNLSKIDHELSEKDLETAVKDATRNLRGQTLYLLLEVPIVLSNNLITKILYNK